MNIARKTQPTSGSQLKPPHDTQQRRVREALIEARLHALTEFIEDFNDGAFSAVLSERAFTREAVEELCVKESALRWILRVAKHSEGAVREKLWSDIEEAVTGLEKLAESLAKSGKVICFPGAGAFRQAPSETPCIS